MRSNPLVRLTLVLSSSLALAGCFGGGVKTGDDIKPINAVGVITAQEWREFAEELRSSMEQSGVLERYRGPEGEPVPLMIGDFFNNTNDPAFQVQKDVMYNEIRKALVNSGRAQILMDAGGSGAQIDRSVGDAIELHGSSNYDASTLPEQGKFVGPRLTLSGQFIRIAYAEGFKKQADYACDVKLVDNRTALSCWEDQVIFSKQGRRGPGSGKPLPRP
jgi:PBP1b-binding outer membrane lipoprotein LpoB